jgi:hypothetical protein
MVATASAAVRDDEGRLLGHVQAGVLLNRNLPFIDKLNDIVYPEGSLPWGSQGTATLFLDDVRISTNVRLFGGEGRERAIGTRVSGKVREAVLGRGVTWLDRAFVVSDWYVSGYEPIADRLGRRVGMLYVGFLERPFTWLKYGVLATIGAIFFAVMIAGQHRLAALGARHLSAAGADERHDAAGGGRRGQGACRPRRQPRRDRRALRATSTTCWTRWTSRRRHSGAGTPSSTPRWPSAPRRWRPRSANSCGPRSWRRSASSRPAWRTR